MTSAVCQNRKGFNKRMATLPALAGYLSQGSTAANWWEVSGVTCVAAYQSVGAASLAASYVNLANPGTYDAAPGVAPSWASGTGWAFDGTTQWLTTGISGYTLDWTLLIRWANWTSTAGGIIAGAYTSSTKQLCFRKWSPNYVTAYGNADANSTGYNPGGWNAAVGCLAGVDVYGNGIYYSSLVSATPYSPPTATMAIGSREGGANKTPCDILALSIYSSALNAAQVATVSAAAAALA